MAWVVLIVSLSAPLALSMVAMQKGLRWVPWLIVGFGLCAILWCIWQVRQASGLQGLNYVYFVWLVLVPAVVGAAIGALITWIRNRKGPGDQG